MLALKIQNLKSKRNASVNPAPPFDAGCPENAGGILVEQVKQFGKPLLEATLAQTKITAANL